MLTLAQLLLFLLAVFGMTGILVDSAIMAPLREFILRHNDRWLFRQLQELLSCYRCTGLHVSVLLVVLMLVLPADAFTAVQLVLAGSAAAYLIDLAASRLERH